MGSSEVHGVFRLSDAAVAWRDVGGEIVGLDVANGTYFTLNGSGRVLWLALVEASSVEDLAEALRAAYGVSGDRAMSDATTFLEDLVARELVWAGD